MQFIYNSPYTVVSVLLMVILLFIKAKHHPPIITDEGARKFIQLASLVLLLTGAIGTAVLLIKDKPWEMIDIYVSLFFFGLFITGLIAETNPDPKKNKVEEKGKKKKK